MFTLNNRNLPINTIDLKNINNTFILKNNEYNITHRTINLNNIIPENKIASYDPDLELYVVENVTSNIASLYTEHSSLTLAEDPENIQNNEFVISNNRLYIRSDKKINNVVVPQQNIYFQSLQFNKLDSLLRGLPLEGGFTITESFQDHPTANLIFISNQLFLQQYRIRFQNGTLIKLFKYGFIVNSYNEEIIKNTNEVKVSISLRGKWDLYVNKNIPLNKSYSESNQTFDPDCVIENEESNYISIQGLANKIDAKISGISFNINKKFPIDINESTTIFNEINKYVDIKESFVDFNSDNAIRVKRINNVRTWNIGEKNLLENFITNVTALPYNPVIGTYPIQNQIVLNNSLVPNYITTNNRNFPINENVNTIPKIIVKNVVADNVFLSSGKIEKDEKTKSNVPQFELRSTKTYIVLRGDLDASTLPKSITTLTDLNFNFDKNGVTKTLIISTEEEDGTKMQEKIYTYGFAYRAFEASTQIQLPGEEDVSYVIRGNPANFWGLIEQKTVNYSYDDETGYFLGTSTSGKRLLRYKIEEDSEYEDYIEIENDPELDNFDIAERNSRIFQWIPLYAIKIFLLHQHRDYYKEFDKPERFIKKCLPDGSSMIVKDPTYVEPMFAKGMSEEIQCFSHRQNPENIERESGDPIYPPYTRGQETYNRFFLKILDSQNTKPGYVLDTNLPKEDRYITYNSNYTAQESGFSTIIEEVTSSTSSGIPPIHTKKQPKYKLVEPDKEEEEKEPDYYKYIFYNSPFDGKYPRTDTVNFKKAKNIDEVVKGYKNQLKIEDMRSTLSSTCKIPINLNMSAGDKINITVGGVRYKRRIISINHQFILNGKDKNGILNVVDGGTDLNMGIERDIAFNIKKEKNRTTSNKNTNNPQFILNENDLILGRLLSKKVRTRGNYYTQDGDNE